MDFNHGFTIAVQFCTVNRLLDQNRCEHKSSHRVGQGRLCLTKDLFSEALRLTNGPLKNKKWQSEH